MAELRVTKTEATEVIPRVADCAFCARSAKKKIKVKVNEKGLIPPPGTGWGGAGGGGGGIGDEYGCLIFLGIVVVLFIGVLVAKLVYKLLGKTQLESNNSKPPPAADDGTVALELPACRRHAWNPPKTLRLKSRGEQFFVFDGFSEEFVAAFEGERIAAGRG